MRYKRLNLNSVSLTTHPLTCELTQHDRFELSVTNDLSFLSRQHAQCLLDVHPLPCRYISGTLP